MNWDFVFILEVVIGFGLLIFIHELGHFLAAKWVGVRVERFSLGFGPKLFGFKKGETEYMVSAIPLGGYVKMAGEFCLEDRKGEPYEFYSKTPGQRAIIITAGPVMNLVFGIPAAMLVFVLGINQPSTLCDVAEGYPAYAAGLRSGARILTVNEEPVLSFFELKTGILLAKPGEPITLDYVDESGKARTATVPTSKDDRELGIEPYRGMTVYAVSQGSPAEKAGIRRGDRIVAADDQPLERWSDLEELEASSPGKAVTLTIERPKPDKNTHPEYEPQKLPATFAAHSSHDLGMSVEFVARPVVGDRQSGWPGEAAGLRRDDAILSIDGQSIRTWEEMREIVSQSAGQKLHFKIERQGQTLGIDIVPRLKGDRGLIGILPGSFVMKVKEITLEDGPAAKAGLKAEDLVYEINGLPFREAREGRISRWKRKWLGRKVDEVVPWLNQSLVMKLLIEREGQPVRFSYRRAGEDGTEVTGTAEATSIAIQTGYLGVRQGVETVFLKYGPIAALKQAFPATGKVVRDTGKSFYRLVTGGISPRNMAGPAGIAKVLFYKAQEGFSQFVHLLFIISVNLALINLVPIPILDGGHLVLLAAEKLKGRPVREKTMAALQYAGLAFLLALVVYVTRNDILNFF